MPRAAERDGWVAELNARDKIRLNHDREIIIYSSLSPRVAVIEQAADGATILTLRVGIGCPQNHPSKPSSRSAVWREPRAFRGHDRVLADVLPERHF